MKIILLSDVKKLGKRGEIVEANDGYARNFIIPKNLGAEATPKNLNDLKQQRLVEEKKREEILEEARETAKSLEGKKVKLSLKLGKEGKPFGQISTKEIANEAKKQLGIELDKKKMIIDPIRELGTYTVSIKLHPEVTGELKVEVGEA